jgi:hypothetical protein
VYVSCHCSRRRMTRIRPVGWLPKISMRLTLDQLSRRLRCAECGGALQSMTPWRQANELGKPQGVTKLKAPFGVWFSGLCIRLVGPSPLYNGNLGGNHCRPRSKRIMPVGFQLDSRVLFETRDVASS